MPASPTRRIARRPRSRLRRHRSFRSRGIRPISGIRLILVVLRASALLSRIPLRTLQRYLPLALIAALGLWLHTRELDRRPMHADEANQAVKTGELLESGHYVFDPRDHHGPTLYYFALPVAWLRGERTLAQLSETTVRFVPALAGTLAIVLLGLLAAPLGRWPALAAATFLALSPPAVYYSRYFIQETLLVTFTLGAIICVREWWRHGRMGWLIGAGACVGLMLATKANSLLFIVATVIAGLATRRQALPPPHLGRHLGYALGTAILVAFLFFSSFGTHFRGVADAFAAFAYGSARLAGPTGHEKTWSYYLELLTWVRSGGLVWEQIVFFALACGGLGLAMWHFGRRSPDAPLLRATAIYTLIVGAVLSATPYKTPWHVIHLVPGLCFLAGAALAAIARLRTGRLVAAAAVALAFGSLSQHTWRAAFTRAADPRNPYAYVHSAPDVLKIRPLVEAALKRYPNQPVRIISEEHWPLPWYLRGLPQVGYWSKPPVDCEGSLVIVSTSLADTVKSRLTVRDYQESMLGLRPGFICVILARP